ncbi:MAG: fumarylacetoacetate hydrolase family protein [Cyclobacteriaceae bacterium]|nr:fumarylacetoacetate hydrolase family protein [Cyclobacteriaceae bacterium]
MRLYKTKSGILIEHEETFFQVKKTGWDEFFNDDNLYEKMKEIVSSGHPAPYGEKMLREDLEAPIQNQEIWASGVTYFNSKLGRQEESREKGGAYFYAHVYEAERPELFFKATAHRTVGPGGKVVIRPDSTWDVPEPELTLAITSTGKIVGYTIGNDMSSRSIEGENPLYLPQAKTYDGSAALGPGIWVSRDPLKDDTMIHMLVQREGKEIFKGKVGIDQMKRKPAELVAFLFRSSSFPYGCFLMTGTGIVPSREFTLRSGDEIRITIEPIGTLINTVR